MDLDTAAPSRGFTGLCLHNKIMWHLNDEPCDNKYEDSVITSLVNNRSKTPLTVTLKPTRHPYCKTSTGRAVSSNACRSRRSGRHARVPFTATQAAALEAAYSRAPYLAPPALRALAAALQLRDDRIKIWFQNRRARERREKCSTITPPRPVALAPTPRPVHSPWSAHAPDLASLPNQDIFITNLQGIHAFEEPSESSLNSSNEETPDELLDVVTVDE